MARQRIGGSACAGKERERERESSLATPSCRTFQAVHSRCGHNSRPKPVLAALLWRRRQLGPRVDGRNRRLPFCQRILTARPGRLPLLILLRFPSLPPSPPLPGEARPKGNGKNAPTSKRGWRRIDGAARTPQTNHVDEDRGGFAGTLNSQMPRLTGPGFTPTSGDRPPRRRPRSRSEAVKKGVDTEGAWPWSTVRSKCTQQRQAWTTRLPERGWDTSCVHVENSEPASEVESTARCAVRLCAPTSGPPTAGTPCLGPNQDQALPMSQQHASLALTRRRQPPLTTPSRGRRPQGRSPAACCQAERAGRRHRTRGGGRHTPADRTSAGTSPPPSQLWQPHRGRCPPLCGSAAPLPRRQFLFDNKHGALSAPLTNLRSAMDARVLV